MKIRTHISIEKEILAQAKEHAKRLGMSLSTLVSIRIAMIEPTNPYWKSQGPPVSESEVGGRMRNLWLDCKP